MLVKKEYKMTMPILQNRYYTLSVAGTMGRNSVVAMLGNYMVIGRLKNNTITFRITDFTEEDTIVLICPEGGSITHAQLERGNKASDWTPAPEDAQEYTKNKVAEAKKYVDDLEVGGRNLLKNTSETWTDERVSEGAWQTFFYPDFNTEDLGLKVGDVFTAQVELKTTSTNGLRFRIEQFKNSTDRNSVYATEAVVNETKMVTATGTIMADRPTFRICVSTVIAPTTEPFDFQYRKLKLEKGNKATDWTPAPEDVEDRIGQKADASVTDGLENSITGINTSISELGIDTLKEQLSEYQEVLSTVGADATDSRAQLESILSPENGRMVFLENNIANQNERWNTLDGFIEVNGAQTALSINKGSVNLVIDSEAITFYSGGSPVATITNQYMKIDRGIFVESMHVGRHKFAPLASNRDHFILNYVGDAPN